MDFEKGANNEVNDELKAYKHATSEHAIVAVIDETSRITFANDNFCVLSQYSLDELIDKNYKLFNSEFHSEDFFQDIFKTIEEGEVWHGNIKNEAKDGSQFWLAMTITSLQNEKESSTKLLTVSTDITDNKRAQEELVAQNIRLLETKKAEQKALEEYKALNDRLKRTNAELAKANSLLKSREAELEESNTRFELAASESKIGIWDRDLVTDFSFWDERMYALFGLTNQEVDINNGVWRNYIHPDDLEKIDKAAKEAFEESGKFELDYRVIWKDDSIHYLHANAIIHRDANGTPIRMIGTVMDVTAQKLAKLALRESETQLSISNTRLQLAADAAKIGIWERDMINHKSYWDETALTIYGISSGNSEMTDEIWANTMHPDDIDFVIKAFEEAVERGEEFEIEHRVIWQDGSIRYLKVNGLVQTHSEGYAEKMIGAIIDVTEQKLSEIALQASDDQLKRDNLLLQQSQSMAKLGGWELDLITSNIYWTEETYKIFDTTPTEFTPALDTVVSFFLPESQKLITEALEDAIKTGKVRDIYLETYTTKGRKIHVRTTAEPTVRAGKTIKLTGIFHDVTEQKLAEKALVESKEELSISNTRFLLAANSAKIGISDRDLINNHNYWNDIVYELYGITDKANIDLQDLSTWDKIIHPDDLEIFHEARRRALANEGVLNTEFRVIWEDQSVHYLKLSGFTIRNKEGEAVRLISTIMDMTDQKLAEKALKESKEQLKRDNILLEASQSIAKLGGWELDLIAEKLFWTATTYKIHETTPEEYDPDINKGLDLFLPESKKLISEALEAAKTSGKPYDLQLERYTLKGRKIYIRTTGEATFQNGKPVKLVGVIQDITEQKLAQAELEASNTRLSVATQSANIGIWEYGVEDNSLLWDDQMFALYGVTKETFPVTFENLTLRVHSDDREYNLSNFQKAIEQEKIFHMEFRVIWPDQSIHHIGVFGKVIRDDSSKPLKVIGANFDVTDRVEKEIELRKAKEKAEENDRLKSAFLANMRHEIRNPLNVIMGFSRQVMAPDITTEERAEYSSIVINSSNQLLSIIDDITSISLLETKQEHVNKSEVNINDLLKELELQFVTQAQTMNIKLEVVTPLPSDQSVIATDKSKLTRIITNLLTNALKFTHAGSISFGYEVKANELCFFVKDTGIGLSVDQQEQIFESFQQADISISRKYGGTGLGLSISKGLVEILGGKIWLKSELDKGSTFYVSLPFDQVNYTAQTPGTIGEPLLKNTILIAEDQVINFQYLKILFQRSFECEILHASNGKEAVDLFKKNSAITLVLMDINMPVMDGFDAARAIKEVKPSLPIIAQTGYDIETNEKYSKEIFNDYVTKPIFDKALIAKVAVYIPEKIKD